MILQNIRVADAKQSKTNVGGRCEGRQFDDLVASVKEKGVLVPVLVRPLEGKGRIGKWEVVAGNRRLAAAKEAGLDEIPAHVVSMTDQEAMEAQIVENLQREGVHPLDEGWQYRRLIEEVKCELASVAAKVGKSESYVRQRLHLTNLEPKPAERYRAGKLMDGHAALIAKLSALDQLRALKVTEDRCGQMTVGGLKEWIEYNVHSRLEFQPWLKSEDGAKIVGKCVECEPSRSTLFGSVKEGECTDVKCWARKMSKWIGWRIKSDELVPVSSEYGNDKKAVYGKGDYEVVGKTSKDRCPYATGAIIVSGADIGHEMDVCVSKMCQTHHGQASYYELTPKERAKRKREKEREDARRSKASADIAGALAKIIWPPSDRHVDLLLDAAMYRCGGSYQQQVAARRGIKAHRSEGGGMDYESLLRADAGDDSARKLALAIELIMPSYNRDFMDDLKKFLAKF